MHPQAPVLPPAEKLGAQCFQAAHQSAETEKFGNALRIQRRAQSSAQARRLDVPRPSFNALLQPSFHPCFNAPKPMLKFLEMLRAFNNMLNFLPKHWIWILCAHRSICCCNPCPIIASMHPSRC
jgi:hypothetical protein